MASSLTPTVVLSAPQRHATLHLTSAKTAHPRETTAIQFRDCYNGIGIKVIGGSAEGVTHGIFIKRLIAEGKAAVDGRLQVGDELVRVNGQPLEKSTYSDALCLLREATASGQVTLVVSRDDNSGREFASLMEDELTTASESSRATTPLDTFDSSHSSATLQSESSLSQPASPPQNNQSQTAMNNNQSGLTRTFSQNSGNRQEIQRLANIFSHKLPGAEAMASTPYDGTKESNQLRAGVRPSTRRRIDPQPDSLFTYQPARGAMSTYPTGDSALAQTTGDAIFAQQLYTSMNSDAPGQRGDCGPQPIPPDTRCSLEKLHTAMRFLGLNITEQQKLQLQAMLPADSSGLVSYGQFIHLAKRMFQDDLRQWDASGPPNTVLSSTLPRDTRLTLPSRARTSTASTSALTSVTQDIAYACSDVEENTTDAADLSAEIRQLQKENFELRRKIHSLSKSLNEQTQLSNNAEKNLHKFRAETQNALEETMSLKEKLQLATESQRIASQQEQEYERVIEGLEHEIKILKDNEARQLESPTVRKKLTILGSQLRKSEERRKTYYVATQKLLDYCQQVYNTLSGKSKHTRSRQTPQQMATDTLDVMNAVRTLLERDPLPFGWEECYSEDGSRYFINHVTEETSWIHPVSHQDVTTSKRIV